MYRVDGTMKVSACFVGLLHFIFCVAFFSVVLNGDIGVPGALWIMDYFFYYPAGVYLLVEFYRWRDSDGVLQKLDKDGDGKPMIFPLLLVHLDYLISSVWFFQLVTLIFCTLPFALIHHCSFLNNENLYIVFETNKFCLDVPRRHYDQRSGRVF